MWWCNFIFHVFLAITIPLTVYLSSSFNYYSDYLFAKDVDRHAFDFIVVGSGSAGAVVATRLSKNYKVLLLEAGGDPNYFNGIPGFALDLLGYPGTDWKYKTVPQKHACKGLNNQQSSWNRGKVLGGSSTLNYMLYLRGHPTDYNNWAKITGDPEWNYENVLPFFKKSIKKYNGKFKGNKKHYGESEYGFLSIEEMNYTPLRKEFMSAGKDLGYDEIDVNGPQRSGFGDLEVNQKEGERAGTYYSLLKTPRNPQNLWISKYSQAIKIRIDKSGKAVGVWFLQHGVKKYASARMEVISSAGSIDSPKLLMLSGIGPKEHLKKVGIKTKVNLPVGKNLQDHPMSIVYPITVDQPVTMVLERNLTAGSFGDYLMNGKGVFTAPSAMSAQAFISSSLVNKKVTGDWPDLQLFFLPLGASPGASMTFTNALNYKPGFIDSVVGPHSMKDGIHFIAVLGRPKSRGEITLKEKNPLSDPIIDPNYFEHPDDAKRVVEGVKFGLKVLEETKTFKSYNAQYTKESLPECATFKFRSDEYWDCYVRHNTLTVWHPVGTCAMGRGVSDPSAVLDSKLRVLGIKGLRVIDASIMPTLVNANTNAAAIMIGEKGSHFVLEYWASQFLVCDRQDRLLYKDNAKCYYYRLV